MTINEVAAALDVDIRGALQGAAISIASELMDKISPYPPSGAGNLPRAWVSRGQNSWYQRGAGSRWVRKNGTVGSASNSQTLGRRWSVSTRNAGAVLGNSASYAPIVQSASRQSATFSRIGWTTDKQAVNSVVHSGVIRTILTQALSRAFAAKAR